MRRLYCMLPDVETCSAVVGELEAEGIPERHLHVIASDAVPLKGLPEASIIQKSEFASGIEKGIGLGGAAGLLGGILAVAFPPAGLVVGGQALLLMAAAGAGFGGIVSGLVAKDIPNHKLKAYEEDLYHGRVLLLVDVPKREVDKWSDLIRQHHPEAEIGGSEIPAS
jgi:hypothetical protein